MTVIPLDPLTLGLVQSECGQQPVFVRIGTKPVDVIAHQEGQLLVRAGFALPVMDMEKLVLTYDTARAVMQDLKAIGAHNATAGRKRGLMGKHAWQRVEAAYETFRRDGKLPATYEVVYGHAWRGQPKKADRLPDGSQVIQFERSTPPRAD